MLPTITELELNIEETETLPTLGKSFLYDFKTGDFIMKNGKLVVVEGIEALKVWIEKVIRTKKFHFKIYENVEYGCSIDDLIGSNYPSAFIESELKREITSVLVEHPCINNIEGWEFERDGTHMTIKFTVVTVEGVFVQEVIV